MPTTVSQTPPQDNSKLIALLLSHKQDAESFFTFIKDNRESLKQSFQKLSEHAISLMALTNMPLKPEIRAEYNSKMPDESSKALLNFILDNPFEARELIFLANEDKRQIKFFIDFAADHAPELIRMAKFVGDHPKEMEKIDHMAAKSDGKISDISFLKTPSLYKFYVENMGEILGIAKFSHDHGREMTDQLIAIDPFTSYLQAEMAKNLLQAAFQNPDRLKLIASGMHGFETGLAPTLANIEKMSQEAYQKQLQQENTEKTGKLKQAFIQLKETAPAEYKVMLQLEAEAVTYGSHGLNAFNQIFEWDKKRDAVDPHHVIPLLDPVKLAQTPGLLTEVDKIVKQQTPNTKSVSYIQLR